MANQENRSSWLNIAIDPNSPNLLAGLDSLLALGLIDDRQVQNLCRIYLTCPIPVAAKKTAAMQPILVANRRPEPQAVRQPSLASNIWTAFKDELSVRWLLFLGVFLVILSSGVLAATQWQSFPAWGQYGVLWAYTIVFWAVGFWASSQAGLSLTANTLKIVALLLVPVNFWAIDSFQLWNHPWGWMTTGFATISLSMLVYLDTRQRQQTRFSPIAIAYLIGSYLQLGWHLSSWATISVYLGAIGAVGIWQQRRHIFQDQSWQWSSLAIYSLTILLLRALFIVRLPFYNFGLAIGIMGWLVAQWSLQEWLKIDRIEAIGNKLSVTGQRDQKLVRQQLTAINLGGKYQTLAIVLLALGWLLAMSQWLSKLPLGSSWQPSAVNGLMLIWLGQRLQQRRRSQDLITMFVIGLQTYGVSFYLGADFITNLIKWDIWKRLLPIFGENVIWASTLVVMPYLLLWVGISGWLQRKQEDRLAAASESLIFIGGFSLNILSIPNSLGLLLNLLISTLALIYITHRPRVVKTDRIYITHFYGLVTIAAGTHYVFPGMQALFHKWWPALPIHHALGVIGIWLTLLAIGEWLVSTLPAVAGSTKDRWYRSAWHYGLGLVPISYGAYALAYNSFWTWGWFLLPLTLAWLGNQHFASLQIAIPRSRPWQIERQTEAATYSIGSLLLAQGLTLNNPDWCCWGLGLSVGIMFFNIQRLRNLAAVMIHIGFGLGLIGSLLERWVFGSHWLIAGSISCLALWIAAAQLGRRNSNLARLYARASDYWAGGLATIGVGIGTINYGLNNLAWLWDGTPTTLAQQSSILMGSAILAIGLWYRDRLFTKYWTLWAISWILELGIAAIVHLSGGNSLTLSIVNVALAFPLFWIIKKSGRDSSLLLPWLYAGLGILLRLPYFNVYTGTLSIGLGIISLLVGKSWRGSIISYLGLLAITLGCYELVTYQIMQAPAGNIADGFTIYGLVTAILALGYRLGVLWWQQRGHRRWLNIPIAHLQTVAHLHWAIASGWKVAAALVPQIPLPRFTIIHLVISLLLGIYAVVQGRDMARQSQNAGTLRQQEDWWVYVGMVEILGTGMYARSIFSSMGILDESLILAACIFGLGIMLAPWSSWGWQNRPWQRIAVVLPLFRVLFVAEQISLWNLLVMASFYGAIAKRKRQFAWIYASLIFLDWAAFRLLASFELHDPLWFAAILGISLLVSVHFDPYFRSVPQRQSRHIARLWGSGAIAITALVFHQNWPLLPAGISLLLVLGGIGLSIRAFLYMGTITLLLTASYQLVILIAEYSFTKWVVGLVAGIMIIAIAGNFERRREQIYTTVRDWFDRLQDWQ
jgi:hypothetical protein